MTDSKKKLEVKKGNIGTWHFTIVVGGSGKTIEEAWRDAVDSVSEEGIGGYIPTEDNIELVNEEE